MEDLLSLLWLLVAFSAGAVVGVLLTSLIVLAREPYGDA